MFTRELWREIRPRTKALMFLIAITLVGAMWGLGYLAYRDRQQSRILISEQSRRVDEQGQRIDEQNDQLVSLKEQTTRSNQQTFGLQQTDQNILDDLTLAPNL